MKVNDTVFSNSPDETFSSGREYAKRVVPGDVIGLFGDLGSGKTQFTKGICDYFRVKEKVNSPTFIIVNEYSGEISGEPAKLFHFDLYRIKDSSDLEGIGFNSYLQSGSICIIEWAELADEFLKGNLKKVFFNYGKDENQREIKFS